MAIVRRFTTLIVMVAALGGGSPGRAQDALKTFNTLVDKDGNITKPQNFREDFQHLGAFMVLDAKGNQMHDTYATPGTAAAFRKTGKFADGTVLVKEVSGTSHGALTTGDVHWATDVKVWFVMIKDSKGRYPKSKLWGEGWGWALFKSDAPNRQVATDFKTDCLGCHQPAKATDWIYVRGYRSLREAPGGVTK